MVLLSRMSPSSITINTQQGVEQVVTQRSTFKEDRSPFGMIGPLHREEKKMDLLDRMGSVSKGA